MPENCNYDSGHQLQVSLLANILHPYQTMEQYVLPVLVHMVLFEILYDRIWRELEVILLLDISQVVILPIIVRGILIISLTFAINYLLILKETICKWNIIGPLKIHWLNNVKPPNGQAIYKCGPHNKHFHLPRGIFLSSE